MIYSGITDGGTACGGRWLEQDGFQKRARRFREMLAPFRPGGRAPQDGEGAQH